MTKDLTRDRYHTNTGRKPLVARVRTALQTMEEMGLNPFKELARLAIKAEKNGDLGTASTNWRYLGEYVDAKRKAIDPAENALKHKQIATLDELAKMKRMILAGTIEAIDESTVIDQEPESFI